MKLNAPEGAKGGSDVATKIQHLNPEAIAKAPGYTHVVEVTGPGRIVYIAGQLGLDAENNLVGTSGDFHAQCKQAFHNLDHALLSVGGTAADVVKINNYLTDISQLALFRDVRDAFFSGKAPPASTTIVISELARPGALFEIEAIVALPER